MEYRICLGFALLFLPLKELLHSTIRSSHTSPCILQGSWQFIIFIINRLSLQLLVYYILAEPVVLLDNLNVPTSATFHIIFFIVYFNPIPGRSSQGHLVRLSLFVVLFLYFRSFRQVTVKFLLRFTKPLQFFLPIGNNFLPDNFPSREGHLLS